MACLVTGRGPDAMSVRLFSERAEKVSCDARSLQRGPGIKRATLSLSSLTVPTLVNHHLPNISVSILLRSTARLRMFSGHGFQLSRHSAGRSGSPLVPYSFKSHVSSPEQLLYSLGKTIGSGTYAKVKAAWSPYERKMVSPSHFLPARASS